MKTKEELINEATKWSEEVFDESELPEHERTEPSDLAVHKAFSCLGFMAGYQAAEPKWISVKDHLPPVGEWVWVWGTTDASRYPMEIAPGMYDVLRWYEVSCDNDGERYTFDVVTHWLELKVDGPKED